MLINFKERVGMPSLASINPLARAIGVFSAVAVLASGATFAALQSQATLTDNTIQSATADLHVNNLENGGEYGETDTGFEFTGLVPGDDYQGEAQEFSLKNNGDVDLGLTIHKAMGEMAIKTDENDPEPGTLDPTKVMVKIAKVGVQTDEDENWVEYTLAQLDEMKNLPGGPLSHTDGSDTQTYSIQVKLLEGAVEGEGGELVDFDLVFTGKTMGDEGEEGDDQDGRQ